tara:strand:+ start:217 stop:339 length:123 start_codon:yes stop_codon:yes gene_type:complete
MEYFLFLILAFLVAASYFLFNLKASKKQSQRSNRIKWRHK